jgi:HEAT repeats
MRKLLVGVIFVTIIGLATLIPGFSPATLAHESTVVAIGKLHVISSVESTTTLNGRTYPAKDFIAAFAVDSVLKQAELLPPVLNLQWTLPLAPGGLLGYGSPADGSYMLLFLKPAGKNYTFTSPYYPGVPASPAASLHNAGVPLTPVSESSLAGNIIEQMCRFAESNSEDAGLRERTLHLLADIKEPKVHETAVKLLEDSNQRVRNIALFILIRMKDASYVALARQEILAAAQTPSSDEGPRNLVLAVTQEFPEQSVPILTAAAKTSNSDLRRIIAYAARSTRSQEAVAVLLPLVDDPDSEVAWNAMHSLGELTNHLDWRPISKDSPDWIRCINLWHEYSHLRQ